MDHIYHLIDLVRSLQTEAIIEEVEVMENELTIELEEEAPKVAELVHIVEIVIHAFD